MRPGDHSAFLLWGVETQLPPWGYLQYKRNPYLLALFRACHCSWLPRGLMSIVREMAKAYRACWKETERAGATYIFNQNHTFKSGLSSSVGCSLCGLKSILIHVPRFYLDVLGWKVYLLCFSYPLCASICLGDLFFLQSTRSQVKQFVSIGSYVTSSLWLLVQTSIQTYIIFFKRYWGVLTPSLSS